MASPEVIAAAPSLIAVLTAVKQFNIDIGADPAKWALNLPGAQLKLIGTVELQFPTLVTAEVGAVQTSVNSWLDSKIASLQAAK